MVMPSGARAYSKTNHLFKFHQDMKFPRDKYGNNLVKREQRPQLRRRSRRPLLEVNFVFARRKTNCTQTHLKATLRQTQQDHTGSVTRESVGVFIQNQFPHSRRNLFVTKLVGSRAWAYGWLVLNVEGFDRLS